MHLYPINGAAHRVAKGDTAWSFRDANFAEVIVGVDPDPAIKKAVDPDNLFRINQNIKPA